MEWTDLEPIVKTVPRVQAAVYVNKDGKPRVRLTLSETFLKETGKPKRANVQAGSDGSVAKIRLVFGDGKFAITDLGKGGARIANIPAIAPVPDGARDAEPCEVETKGAKEAIIILPLPAWEKQLSAPLPPRPAQPMHASARPSAAASSSADARTKKLDVVEYLTTKGLKVAREAGGYRIGRELESKSSALTIVNRYRRAAELEPLGVTDID